ncbi:MAG: hypothetical protein O0X49_05305 [Methanocorpusculum sp.]|nr:hypothetical protein [Methanocorpusculum sp.]
MIILDEITFYSVIGLCFIPTVILIGILLICAPVAFAYLKALLTGYMLIEIDKTNSLRFTACKFKNGMAQPSTKIGKYIKQGLKGSLNIGKVKADFVLNQVGMIQETDYSQAMESLDNIGIETYSDLSILMNHWAAADEGKTLGVDILPRSVSEVLRAHPDYDFTVYYPLLGHVNVKKIAAWVESTPEGLASIIEQNKAEIASRYTNASVGSSTSSKDLMTYAIVGVVLMVGCMIAVVGLGVI